MPRDDDPEDVAEHVYAERDDEYQDPSNPNTFPSGSTVRADREEAASDHGADRAPTPEEERAAEQHELQPEVAERYREAIERGAAEPGEGRIAP